MGTNDTVRQSELTKTDFNHRFNLLNNVADLFLSQVPFPHSAVVLVISAQSLAFTTGFSPLVGFIDNFNLSWD